MICISEKKSGGVPGLDLERPLETVAMTNGGILLRSPLILPRTEPEPTTSKAIIVNLLPEYSGTQVDEGEGKKVTVLPESSEGGYVWGTARRKVEEAAARNREIGNF